MFEVFEILLFLHVTIEMTLLGDNQTHKYLSPCDTMIKFYIVGCHDKLPAINTNQNYLILHAISVSYSEEHYNSFH